MYIARTFRHILLPFIFINFILGCGDSSHDENSSRSVVLIHRADRAVFSTDPDNEGFYKISINAEKGGATVQLKGEKQKPIHGVDLIRLWNDPENPESLSANPPIGTIEGLDSDGVYSKASFQFFDPKWDKRTDTYSYKLKAVSEDDTGVGRLLLRNFGLLPGALQAQLDQIQIQFILKDSALPVGSPLTPLDINSSIYTYTTNHCNFIVNTENEHDSSFISGNTYATFMQICRPEAPEGYYFLSDAAVANQYGTDERSLPKLDLLIVKESAGGTGGNALAIPIDAKEVWRDKGSGGTYDFTIYQPIAPNGYVCLGIFAQEGYDSPNIPSNYRCVRQDLVVSAVPEIIWQDHHSGADQDLVLASPGSIIRTDNFNIPNYGITFGAPPPGRYSNYECNYDSQLNEPSCSLPYMLRTDIAILD